MINKEPDLVDQVIKELRDNNNMETITEEPNENVKISNKKLKSTTNINDSQTQINTDISNDNNTIITQPQDTTTNTPILQNTPIIQSTPIPQNTPLIMSTHVDSKKNIINQLKNPIIVSMLYIIINKDIIVKFINKFIDPENTLNLAIKSIIIGALFYFTQICTPNF
tara:strand:- start:305 stop:805 length:501 start_codon:yes stop_codon:yes gene_type:complete